MWGSEQRGILRAAGFGVDWDSQEEFLLKLTILLTEQLGCSLPRWERKGGSARALGCSCCGSDCRRLREDEQLWGAQAAPLNI